MITCILLLAIMGILVTIGALLCAPIIYLFGDLVLFIFVIWIIKQIKKPED